MRIAPLLTAATVGALLALTPAAPALADGNADTITSETDQVGPVGQVGMISEDDVLHDLRPAVVGVHQGISGGFVEVPPPVVRAPQMPPMPSF
ncbi:hypothetical protein B4N89_02125 [Embleya scabrispora]|uniref:Secreted protein n=1 Tax=Embleya scabrispora TaxID=159449 RepID=A0A1T3NSV8_9ACTN|nr:hypothetical protein [Embleya scabrispora]OPC79898.1 hypothetical protein B4N89_02125 [Embleya scabrispora]